MDAPKIDMISISLTHRCNLKCKMCWQRMPEAGNDVALGQLSFQDCIVILDKLRPLSPGHIYLWGGEPLLHPDIVQIVREVKKRKFMCHMITNGLLLERKAQALIDAKLDRMSISLDGLAQTHDRIRGAKGSYDKTISGLRAMLARRAVRPIISINTVITPENYRELYEMVSVFSTLNVNGLQLQFPVHFDYATGMQASDFLKTHVGLDNVSSWRGFVKSYDSINVPVLEEILARIRHDFPQVGFYPPNQTAKSWFKKENTTGIECGMAWKRVNIEPNGDLSLCTDYSDMVAGNLLTSSFEAIWHGDIYKAFRAQLKKNEYMPICAHCTYSHLPWRRVTPCT